MLDEHTAIYQLSERLAHIPVESRDRGGSHVRAREPALRMTALQIFLDGRPPGLRSEALLPNNVEKLATREEVDQIVGLVIADRTMAFDDWQNPLPYGRLSIPVAVNYGSSGPTRPRANALPAARESSNDWISAAAVRIRVLRSNWATATASDSSANRVSTISPAVEQPTMCDRG